MSEPATMTAATTTPIRVLVVDDQPLFRMAISSLINDEPDLEVVAQAENGLLAVERAREAEPDVVLMDVEMPVMDGIEAAGLMQEHVPDAKVLMLSVVEDDERLVEAVRRGVHGYLLKDLRPDQLFEMIRAAMRDESPVSPALVGRLFAQLRGGTRPPAPAPALEPRAALSERELEILRLVADGLTNRQIGRQLHITEGTVKNHVHNALHKLHMENRIQAAAYVVRHGLGLRPQFN